MKYTILLAALLSFSLAHAQPETEKPDPALDYDGAEAKSCVIDDGSEGDDGWDVMEAAIPPCKRAFVSINAGAELDLGAKRVVKVFRTGVTAFKAKVISGEGSYTLNGKIYPLKGVNVWVTLNRCEMRTDVILTDARGRDVTSFKDARLIKTREEVSALAHGDELKHFENDCQKDGKR